MPPTCVPRQVSSISFPVPFDKGNVGNEVSGFRGKTKPTSILFSAWQSLIFALMWFFLHFTPSLRFTFSLQSALILPPVRSLKSAARSPQSSFYTDRYSDIWCDRMFWQTLYPDWSDRFVKSVEFSAIFSSSMKKAKLPRLLLSLFLNN